MSSAKTDNAKKAHFTGKFGGSRPEHLRVKNPGQRRVSTRARYSCGMVLLKSRLTAAASPFPIGGHGLAFWPAPPTLSISPPSPRQYSVTESSVALPPDPWERHH